MGFFDSKTKNTTNQYDSSDNSATSTNGANSDAFSLKDGSSLVINDLGYDGLKLNASLSADGMAANAKSFNNVVSFADSALDRILDAKENDLNAVSNATFKALDKNLDFAGDVVAGNSKFAKDMTEFYLNQNAKENNANRNMLMDTQQNVVDAWQGATKSTMALSTDYMSMLKDNQETALGAIMKSSQNAQDTTLKAMNGIFESSKTSTERVIDNSLKYIVFGVIGLFAIPFLSKTFAK